MRVSLESIRNAICSVFLDIILMVNGNDTVHVTSKFQKITLCKSKASFLFEETAGSLWAKEEARKERVSSVTSSFE